MYLGVPTNSQMEWYKKNYYKFLLGEASAEIEMISGLLQSHRALSTRQQTNYFYVGIRIVQQETQAARNSVEQCDYSGVRTKALALQKSIKHTTHKSINHVQIPCSFVVIIFSTTCQFHPQKIGHYALLTCMTSILPLARPKSSRKMLKYSAFHQGDFPKNIVAPWSSHPLLQPVPPCHPFGFNVHPLQVSGDAGCAWFCLNWLGSGRITIL